MTNWLSMSNEISHRNIFESVTGLAYDFSLMKRKQENQVETCHYFDDFHFDALWSSVGGIWCVLEDPIFTFFFWQVRIKAQRVLSSCIDVFDNFARTLVPPTLSKLQNNPDVSHEEFKVCCPFIVGYNCSLSRKFLQFLHVLRLSSNFPMQWFETRRYLK